MTVKPKYNSYRPASRPTSHVVSHAGYTLIELMVVVAIIGIVTAIMLVSMSGGKDTTVVRSTARQVAAAARLAQNNALTGRMPEPGRIPCDFSFTASGSSYSIGNRYHTTAVGSGCQDDLMPITYTTPPGVTVSGNPATFTVPRGTVSAATSYTIQRGAAIGYVCINAAGRITESMTSCN